jgi:hypothetical protein
MTALLVLRRNHPRLRLHFAGLATIALLVGTQPAWASPAFPGTVRDHLAMDCTPDCTLCHHESPGVARSTDTVFAAALKVAPCTDAANPACATVVATDTTSLKAALDRLVAASSDVDGDTILDVDELRGVGAPVAGQRSSNPNSPANGDICGAVASYGCGAHVASHADEAEQLPWVLAAGALLTALYTRRRRTVA